jgi:signal transduction histidine kinase
VQSEKLAGIGRLAAGVAHEINNPLGVILGYVRLLKKKSDEAVTEDLKVIEDETLRCQEIVEGLLELSRPLKAEPEAVELRELCDEVVERLSETGLSAQVELTVTGSGEVRGHSTKLRQVFFNLVKNALEAAGPGGKVKVEIGPEPGAVVAAISDSGPGIAPDARGKLFEPFFTTKAMGTGMGLAVSQAIARAHGGAVVAGQGSLGGACFTLRLPVSEPARQEVG